MQEHHLALLAGLVQMGQAREVDEVAEVAAGVFRDPQVEVILYDG